MNLKITDNWQTFVGFASYNSRINTEYGHLVSQMWCQRLLKKHLQCDPFTLRQMTSFLFVVHDSGSELVATRLSVEFPPLHDELPCR